MGKDSQGAPVGLNEHLRDRAVPTHGIGTWLKDGKRPADPVVHFRWPQIGFLQRRIQHNAAGDSFQFHDTHADNQADLPIAVNRDDRFRRDTIRITNERAGCCNGKRRCWIQIEEKLAAEVHNKAAVGGASENQIKGNLIDHSRIVKATRRRQPKRMEKSS